MLYEEDDMLMLSGIQHFAFCPRQWALIHLEQIWEDNHLTIEGQIMHQHVNDPFYRQKMGDIICLRSVNIASKRLGLYGLTDLLELHPSDSSANTITHPRYPGFWHLLPVEYKHGNPKPDNVDAVQLTAQAMCLEEQYNIHIPKGILYYGKTRSREIVNFSDDLRYNTVELAKSMHEAYSRGELPHAVQRPHCRNCSVHDICMPYASENRSVKNYLKENLYEETS